MGYLLVLFHSFIVYGRFFLIQKINILLLSLTLYVDMNADDFKLPMHHTSFGTSILGNTRSHGARSIG